MCTKLLGRVMLKAFMPCINILKFSQKTSVCSKPNSFWAAINEIWHESRICPNNLIEFNFPCLDMLQDVPQHAPFCFFYFLDFLCSYNLIFDLSSACRYRICYLLPRCNFVQDITKRVTRSPNWQNILLGFIYLIQCLTVSRGIPLVFLGFLIYFLCKSFKLEVHVNLLVAQYEIISFKVRKDRTVLVLVVQICILWSTILTGYTLWSKFVLV
jgi:hypothetical protein